MEKEKILKLQKIGMETKNNPTAPYINLTSENLDTLIKAHNNLIDYIIYLKERIENLESQLRHGNIYKIGIDTTRIIEDI